MLRSVRGLFSLRRPTMRMGMLNELLVSKQVPVKQWGGPSLVELPAAHETLFAPLFSNEFVFENHQLTMLGDTIVDAYLVDVMYDYLITMGIVATANTVKMLTAVFHNHFTMRMFAEELGFPALCAPTIPDCNVDDATLDFLEAPELGPRAADVAGTSFDFSPLKCGQSALGWKFSHFIGALSQVYGKQAAHDLLEVLYDLKGTSNLGWQAARLLYRLVGRYSPLNVAEALLIAQGIPVEFVAKTVLVGSRRNEAPGDTAGPSATENSNQHRQRCTDESRDGTTAPVGDDAHNASSGPSSLTHRHPSSMLDASVSGFGSPDERRIQSVVNDATLRASTLGGPGYLDALGGWRDRALKEVVGSDGGALEAAIPSGWMTPEDHGNEKRGPAYAGFVDFTAHAFFADAAGIPQPEQGKHVGRVPFVDPVRDKPFFDKASEFRDGLPMDTNGMTMPQFLKTLNEPHERQFEVSMVVNGTTVLGRAVSRRYTTARLATCQGYLIAVARDLERFTPA